MKSREFLIYETKNKITLLAAKVILWLSIAMPLRADQVDVAGKLSEEFKGYAISSIKDEKLGAKALLYEFPNNTLEILSRQNLLGVVVVFDEAGAILSVRPKAVEVNLPDQEDVNKFVDDGKSITELLEASNFEKMDPIQMFGLLTKWATSVLSANDNMKINVKLSENYTKVVMKLLGGNIEWPEDLLALSREEVESLAKKIGPPPDLLT